MSVNKDVFLSVAPKLIENGFIITPIYHNDPNLDFKEAKVFPKGWNQFDRTELVRTVDDIEKIDWGRFLCYLTLPSPGTVILDVDAKTPEQKELAKSYLADLRLLKRPDTLIISTPSGGAHLYYKVNERINASKFGGCVDIQQAVPDGLSAQGCYGPGCLRAEGMEYRIAKDSEISLLPDNIVNWMGVKVETTELEHKGKIEHYPKYIPKGDRDNVLSGIAASMVKHGYSRDDCIEHLIFLRDNRLEGPEDFSDEILIEKVERVLQKKQFMPDDKVDLDALLDRLVFIRDSASIFDKIDKTEYPENKAKLVYAPYEYEVTVKEEVKRKPAFPAWIKFKARDEANQVSYLPGEGEFYVEKTSGRLHYNSYSSPIHRPVEGDFSLYIDAFKDLCAHLYPSKPDFFLQYAAYLCQDERHVLDFMVILISEVKGIGKNLYSEILTNLLGFHNVASARVSDLGGSFNSHLVDSRLVIINEMETSFHKKDVDAVKTMITEATITRKQKFLIERTQRVSFSFLGFSNRLDTHVIEQGDRRFTVLKSESGKIDRELMLRVSEIASNKAGNRQTNHDAVDALWAYLQTVAVDDTIFSNTAEAMHTEEKEEIRIGGMYGLTQEMAEMVNNREGPFAGDIYTIPMVQLYYNLINNETIKRVDIKKALKEAGALGPLRQKNGRGGRQVVVNTIDLNAMMITPEKNKIICYVCRHPEKYLPGCNVKKVNEQLITSYEAIRACNPTVNRTNVVEFNKGLDIPEEA